MTGASCRWAADRLSAAPRTVRIQAGENTVEVRWLDPFGELPALGQGAPRVAVVQTRLVRLLSIGCDRGGVVEVCDELCLFPALRVSIPGVVDRHSYAPGADTCRVEPG